MVMDRLRELQEELGLDGILAELNCGSLIPHELVMNSLRLLCEKVMPAFRKAAQERGKARAPSAVG
jgi:hypothetical protein